MNGTRNGKIARLPRSIRQELNRRLDEGESENGCPAMTCRCTAASVRPAWDLRFPAPKESLTTNQNAHTEEHVSRWLRHGSGGIKKGPAGEGEFVAGGKCWNRDSPCQAGYVPDLGAKIRAVVFCKQISKTAGAEVHARPRTVVVKNRQRKRPEVVVRTRVELPGRSRPIVKGSPEQHRGQDIDVSFSVVIAGWDPELDEPKFVPITDRQASRAAATNHKEKEQTAQNRLPFHSSSSVCWLQIENEPSAPALQLEGLSVTNLQKLYGVKTVLSLPVIDPALVASTGKIERGLAAADRAANTPRSGKECGGIINWS